MKTALLVWIPSLFLAVPGAHRALAQSLSPVDRASLSDRVPIEKLRSQTAAAGGGPSIRVSKTAFVDGQDVCGLIRITNTGSSEVSVTAVADSLEVHFPRTVTPPPLPAGSTATWFKVADVPIAPPGGVIAPGTTATIDYCFPLCSTADAPGANSMRNVVTITATDQAGGVKMFTTRSVSFPPPLLDCQACCLPDGSCIDTEPDECAVAAGLARGVDTDCATTECTQACCYPDDSCSDDHPSLCAGESKGLGTDCASTQCCIALGELGCTSVFDCCSNAGGVNCLQGRCCAAAGLGCDVDTDCCDAGAICTNGTCCITAQNGLCFDDSDCCSGVPCVGNICCAPPGLPGSCNADGDCCDPGQTCNSGTCCIPLGDPGCTSVSDCCSNAGGVFCNQGRCCAAARQGCNADADCCDAGAICTNATCCISIFGSCFADSDCCSGLVCTGGLCDSLISP